MKKNLVVLTGAGISAESGLRTFRGADGLWEGYNVEDVATARAWHRNMALVLRFYNERRVNVAEAQPNAAHYILAELEDHFNVHIITQNIDDLHERAGSTNILHLHGEIFKMRSERKPHDETYASEIRGDINMGDHSKDGGQYRPHIVWFEEPVPAITEAIAITQDADIFVVVGTSLEVYPAAGLFNYVPAFVPKYVVDKRIPEVGNMANLTAIEKPATVGMADLKQMLIATYIS